MSLSLLYGSTLSGKTEELYEGLIRDSIAEPEKQFILLVPEQASLTAQEELIRRHPRHALFNIDVLTFNRLAFRVFSDTHEPGGKLLDDLGKILLLRLVAVRLEDQLTVLKRNARKPGFSSELKSVISELSQYNVSAEALQSAQDKFKEYPLLQGKMKDIALIYQEFLKLLHERYELTEERTARLARCLNRWEPLSDTVIALDGYTGFTPPQYNVLETLIANAREVRLTVTIGSNEQPDHHKNSEDLFYMGVHMAECCKKIAERNSVITRETFICPREASVAMRESFIETEAVAEKAAGSVAKEIRHLESSLFRYPTKKYKEETDQIRLVRAGDRATEVQYILSEIRAAVRDGYEYREMAVICGEPEAYASEIDAQFGEAKIPYFIDGNRELAQNPLYLFVQDLMAVLEENYSFDTVFRLLKNPIMQAYAENQFPKQPYGEKYTPIQGCMEEQFSAQDGEWKISRTANPKETAVAAYERISEMENYVLLNGIRGRAMYDSYWTRTCPGFRLDRRGENLDEALSQLGLQHETGSARESATTAQPISRIEEAHEKALFRVNETRDILLKPIIEFSKKFSAPQKSAKDRAAELLALLEKLGASETMSRLAESLTDEKDILVAVVYGRCYEKLLELFDRIVEIMGEEKLTAEEYREVVLAGVTQTLIGVAPPTKDRLVIGDLQRTRLSHIRKLFVMGANEGTFPGMKSGSGLLTDRDRELLKEQDIVLSATAREEAFFVRFYLYLLLTAPSESILMTYALTDADGKAMNPSYVIGTLRGLFPNMKTETASKQIVNSGEEVLGNLAILWRRYREKFKNGKEEPDEGLKAYYSWAFQGDGAEELEIIRRGLSHAYREERLKLETAQKLYQKEIKGSVSRLESFASCPYKHFLRYGLHLDPQKEYGIDQKGIGNLFHDSINEFFKGLSEKGLSFGELSEPDRLALVEESVRKVTENVLILRDGAHNAYLTKRVERITNRTIDTLKRQWDAGSFERIESEVPFDANEIPKLRMSLSEGVMLSLNGRIDRLDLSEDGNSIWVKVIDYKSGAKKIDYSKIYYGLQLQLLLYLKAAMERESGKNHSGKEIIPAGIYYYHIDDPIVEACDDPDASIQDALRMNGLTNEEDETIEKIESGSSQPGSVSTVITGLKKKKDGDFYSGAAVASTEELRRLSDFALEKSREISCDIMEGHIEVRPVNGIDNGCQYCDYHDVCGFDLRMKGFKSRYTEKKEMEDLLGEDHLPTGEQPEGQPGGNHLPENEPSRERTGEEADA